MQMTVPGRGVRIRYYTLDKLLSMKKFKVNQEFFLSESETKMNMPCTLKEEYLNTFIEHFLSAIVYSLF